VQSKNGMNRRVFFLGAGFALLDGSLAFGEANPPTIRFFLNPGDPSKSYGEIAEHPPFPVGLGRDGVSPPGSPFKPGRSLLGDFQVNAILAKDRFEMDSALIHQSGKTEPWLHENLFRNMSSIDFDADGQGHEYGAGFIGLQPINSTARHPFHFGEYKGVFRWYSYAIHGTQNDSRIGKRSTGGCINVGKDDLVRLLGMLKLGDKIRVQQIAG